MEDNRAPEFEPGDHPGYCRCPECDPDSYNDERRIAGFTDDHNGAYMAPRYQPEDLDNWPILDLDYAECSSCRAAVIFLPALDSGKTNILDAAPVADGNIAIIEGKAVFARKDRPLPEGEPRYKSHWATCPDAKSIRAQLHARNQAVAKRNSF